MLGAMAIQLLWFLIYAVVFCSIVALVLYGIKTFVYKEMPEIVVKGVWFVVLCLVLIALLTVLMGGSVGGIMRPPLLR